MPSRLAALCFVATFCLALGAGPAFAVSPEHGKINTADASPVDPGNYEAEIVYAYGLASRSWDSRATSNKRGFSAGHSVDMAVVAGIVEHVDLSLGSNFSWVRDKDNDFDADGTTGPVSGSGLGDLSLSARYRFLCNEAAALDVAYIGGLVIPTGTRNDRQEIGISQEYWSLEQTLVASKDWGLWTGNADIGFSLPIGDRKNGAHGALTADLAAGYQILPWVQPEIELNYTHDFFASGGDSEVLAATAGLIMPLQEALRINIGVQRGLWGRNTERETVFSLAIKTAF